MKKKLCKPCAEALKKSGTSVKCLGGRSEKITCDECGKRRFGLPYDVPFRLDFGRVKPALVFFGALIVAVTASAWGPPVAEAMTPPREHVIADQAPEIVHTAYLVPTADKPAVEDTEGEDPNEDDLIVAALEAQGYFRPDVPLSYELQDILQTSCERYGVDYAVALGMIDEESKFDINAINSETGCYGLCQLNPRYFPSGLSPEQNIETGIKYLGEQLEKYGGDYGSALTAYNAGSDTGDRDYANKVLETAERWAKNENH